MRARMQFPTVTLQGYGGGGLNVVGQMKCELSRGPYRQSTKVLVQKNPPLKMLIGTDLHSSLFLQKENDQEATNMLKSNRKWVPKTRETEKKETRETEKKETRETEKEPRETEKKETRETEKKETRETEKKETRETEKKETRETEKKETRETEKEPRGTEKKEAQGSEKEPRPLDVPITVRLVQATRLPPRHTKLVYGRLDEPSACLDTMLFEGCPSQHDGMMVETAATRPDAEAYIPVSVQNHSSGPLWLGEGEILGTVQSAEIVDEVAEVHRVLPVEEDEGRAEKLLELLEVRGLERTKEENGQLEALVRKYADVFALNPEELGRTQMIQHEIDTGASTPVRQPARRIPFTLRKKVEEMVDEMLQREVIKPSRSPWASPIVLTAKKNGTTRFCVDYRRLNSVTKMDVHPLPRIDDSLDQLANSKFFSTLDLASGFWQVGMEASSQEKTAFMTHSGLCLLGYAMRPRLFKG